MLARGPIISAYDPKYGKCVNVCLSLIAYDKYLSCYIQLPMDNLSLALHKKLSTSLFTFIVLLLK